MSDDEPPLSVDGRPVPFVVRVAVEWLHFDAVQDRDGLFFAHRAGLTGVVEVTSGGNDVSFSDLGVA